MHPSKYLITRFVVIMKREEFLANLTQDAVCIVDVLDAANLRQIRLVQVEIQLFPVLRYTESPFRELSLDQEGQEVQYPPFKQSIAYGGTDEQVAPPGLLVPYAKYIRTAVYMFLLFGQCLLPTCLNRYFTL